MNKTEFSEIVLREIRKYGSRVFTRDELALLAFQNKEPEDYANDIMNELEFEEKVYPFMYNKKEKRGYPFDEPCTPGSIKAWKLKEDSMSLSKEEIDALLEEVYDDVCYYKGSVWQHKDGGVYEIIEKVPFVLKEEVDEEISISRNRYLVWYRVRFADKLNDEVFVRTQEHFESSFTWIPNSNLM